MSRLAQPSPIVTQSDPTAAHSTALQNPPRRPLSVQSRLEARLKPELDAFLQRGEGLGFTSEQLSSLVTRGHLKMIRACELPACNEPPDDSPPWDDPAFLVKAYLRNQGAGHRIWPGKSPDFSWMKEEA